MSLHLEDLIGRFKIDNRPITLQEAADMERFILMRRRLLPVVSSGDMVLAFKIIEEDPKIAAYVLVQELMLAHPKAGTGQDEA